MTDETTALPYLSEHQAPRPAEAKPYMPSVEEEKTIRFVMDRFAKYKRHRDRYDKRLLDFYKMFRGRQWPDHRPSWKHSEVVNLIFQTIQGIVPLETDSRPKIAFVPQEPSDGELAEVLNQVCESDWENNNWLMTLIEVVLEKTLYGTGLSSMEYNPDAGFGMGKIEYKSRDPFYCWPDPEARDTNDECRGFIYAEPMDIETVRRKWPEKRDYISADAGDVFGDRTDLTNEKLRSSIDRRMIYEERTLAEYARKDECLVITLWTPSDEYEEEAQETSREDGTIETTYTQRLKYPKGRKIVVCGKCVLEDGPNPYEDGRIPYSRCQNYVLPREFWGISEVEQLEGPQKVFNKLVCMVLDILNLTSNPPLLVSTTSGLDTDNLFNRPGDVWEHDPQQEPKWMQPASVNPVFLQMVDRMKNWFDQLSGANDVTRGVAPASITAASAIEALQEAAQTRTRQKLRLIDLYLKDVGQQYLARVFQFYTVPRVFRITQKDGLEKYFKFSAGTTSDGSKMARVTPFVNEGGQYFEQPPRDYVLRGEFDVRATTGSGLPFQKSQQEQRLIRLFELGVIDAEELLKGMDYPKAEQVLMRLKAAQPPVPQQGGAPVSPPGLPGQA